RRRDARAQRISLARGGALFFLDGPLALDAVAGEGKSFQALLRDGFSAPLAVAEVPLLELLQRAPPLLDQPPVPLPELEQEFPVVRGGSLIAEVFGGIVFRTLGVGYGLPDSFHELAMLLFQLLPELSESLLPHCCLLPRHGRFGVRVRGEGYHASQGKSIEGRPLSARQRATAHRPTVARAHRSAGWRPRRRARPRRRSRGGASRSPRCLPGGADACPRPSKRGALPPRWCRLAWWSARWSPRRSRRRSTGPAGRG